MAKRHTKQNTARAKKATPKRSKASRSRQSPKKAKVTARLKKAAPSKSGTVPRRKSQALSPREKEVIRLVSLGCSVKEAAAILGISPSTVDNHKYSAMHKLGTNKLALVTRLAIKKRITKLNDRLTPEEKERSGRGEDGWN
ncbi:hypothetical protein JCM19992_25470 [Thermostilla marina]